MVEDRDRRTLWKLSARQSEVHSTTETRETFLNKVKGQNEPQSSLASIHELQYICAHKIYINTHTWYGTYVPTYTNIHTGAHTTTLMDRFPNTAKGLRGAVK